MPPTVDLAAPTGYAARVVLYSELRATLNNPLKRVRVSSPSPLVSGFSHIAQGARDMTKDWKTRTKLVHEGSRRSQYGEWPRRFT